MAAQRRCQEVCIMIGLDDTFGLGYRMIEKDLLNGQYITIELGEMRDIVVPGVPPSPPPSLPSSGSPDSDSPGGQGSGAPKARRKRARAKAKASGGGESSTKSKRVKA